MVEPEVILIGVVGLIITYALAVLPPKIFAKWWRRRLSGYVNLPFPELEKHMPIHAQGFWGSYAVSVKSRVKALAKLPKRITAFKERYLWYPTITLCDMKYLALFESLPKTSRFHNVSGIYGEEALMFLDGERAKRDHARLAKAFGTKEPQELQKKLFPIISNATGRLRTRCADAQFELGGFSSEEESFKCALEMAVESCIGLRLHENPTLFRDFAQFTSIGAHPWFSRLGGTTLMKLVNYPVLRSVDKCLQDAIRGRLAGKETGNDMLQMLVDFVQKEEKEAIIEGVPAEDWIKDQLKGLLFASVLPVSQTMCWALALLALNRPIQNTIREELNLVCMDPGNPEERPPLFAELQELKNLDAFLKEVLRLFPVDSLLERVFPKNIANPEIDGVALPRGTEVRFDLLALHRREEFFSEPNDFLPERWLSGKDQGEKRNPPTVNHQAYFPFGLGHRTCLGRHLAVLELKMMVATLVRNHAIFPLDPKQSLPDAYITRGVLRCFPGFDVQFIGRYDEAGDVGSPADEHEQAPSTG